MEMGIRPKRLWWRRTSNAKAIVVLDTHISSTYLHDAHRSICSGGSYDVGGVGSVQVWEPQGEKRGVASGSFVISLWF